MTQPQAPAGWYPDTQQPENERYWDGQVWTEQRRPVEQALPPPPPPPPAVASAKGSSKDYTRICDKCGARWFLPKQWATEKAPKDYKVRQSQRATKWAVGRQRERYSTQALALSSQQDRVLSNAQCPNCGSSDYTQYKPGEEPGTVTGQVSAVVEPCCSKAVGRPDGRHSGPCASD
jgi:hypothetical protein